METREVSIGSLMAVAKILVIKVGSAVLTDASGLDIKILESLARQIASLAGVRIGDDLRLTRDVSRKIVLVSSGAVAAGKRALAGQDITRFTVYERARHGIAAVGQSLLMHAWNEAFSRWGILAGQVLLTREDLRSRPRFQTVAATFAEMLNWGVIPIVNENDTVTAGGEKFGDNDFLASLLVNLVESDLFVNLTSAPGVFDSDPGINSKAAVLDRIENIASLDLEAMCGAKTESGSGGMRSKLLAARRIARIGVPTLILPGREPDVLLKALAGKASGTCVLAAEKSISRRKFWLAYQSEPTGVIEIDDGAARALLSEGGSLLPGGITHVAGEFEKGSLLRVKYRDKNLGVGFSNYSSADLGRIAGLKRHEVAAILGVARYPDAIHRDNLLLDAAI